MRNEPLPSAARYERKQNNGAGVRIDSATNHFGEARVNSYDSALKNYGILVAQPPRIRFFSRCSCLKRSAAMLGKRMIYIVNYARRFLKRLAMFKYTSEGGRRRVFEQSHYGATRGFRNDGDSQN